MDSAQAASLPLTTLTAWERLFDHLSLGPESTGTILVVGAAGGAGSMATQLARTRTRLEVIATASRPESAAFARQLGAHHVVDHTARLAEQVTAIAPDGVDYVFSAYSPQHLQGYAELVRLLAHIVAIDRGAELESVAAEEHHVALGADVHSSAPATGGRRSAPSAPDSHGRAPRPAGGALRTAHRMVESEAVIGKVVIDYGS